MAKQPLFRRVGLQKFEIVFHLALRVGLAFGETRKRRHFFDPVSPTQALVPTKSQTVGVLRHRPSSRSGLINASMRVLLVGVRELELFLATEQSPAALSCPALTRANNLLLVVPRMG